MNYSIFVKANKINLIILSLVNIDAVDADGDAFIVAAEVQRHGSICRERLLQEDRGQLEGTQRFSKVVHEVGLICAFH